MGAPRVPGGEPAEDPEYIKEVSMSASTARIPDRLSHFVEQLAQQREELDALRATNERQQAELDALRAERSAPAPDAALHLGARTGRRRLLRRAGAAAAAAVVACGIGGGDRPRPTRRR